MFLQFENIAIFIFYIFKSIFILKNIKYTLY
jgi:hypothetical protein